MLLTTAEKQSVKRFAYQGGDSSLLYKLVLSPLAEVCVELFTPTWMAPNVITMIGLLCNVFAAVLVVIYNPNFSAKDPDVGWLALVSAVCMFLYQTFDNMDGKQARKTGSSSPLGLLFDHGCDAINVCLSIIPMASALGLGWQSNRTILLFAIIPMIPFYSQTWELFHVKSMVLPIINGPSEGLVVVISLMMTTYYTGDATWFHTPQIVPASLRFLNLGEKVLPWQALTVVSLTGALMTVILNTLNVYSATGHKKGNKSSSRKKGTFLRAMQSLLLFIIFYGSLLTWLSHSSVAMTPTYRWWTLLLFSAVFVEMVSHINIMHVADSVLRPEQRYVVALVAYFALITFPGVRASVPAALGERFLLIPFALIATAVTTHLLYLMNHEVAESLGIYIFVLGSKKLLAAPKPRNHSKSPVRMPAPVSAAGAGATTPTEGAVEGAVVAVRDSTGKFRKSETPGKSRSGSKSRRKRIGYD